MNARLLPDWWLVIGWRHCLGGCVGIVDLDIRHLFASSKLF